MALWKEVILELEHFVGGKDLSGRRLFNTFLHSMQNYMDEDV